MSLRILDLTAERRWFDMIFSREKKEEYREIKDHWARRLLSPTGNASFEPAAWEAMIHDLHYPYARHTDVQELLTFYGAQFREYDAIRFRNGYRDGVPKFLIKWEGIAVKNGREEWGAEKAKFYFTLKLGEILEASGV